MFKTIKILMLMFVLFGGRTFAHSLPDSKAQLVINSNEILMKFGTPTEILNLARKTNVNLNSPQSVDSLKQYLLKHISISDKLQSKWEVSIGKIYIQKAEDQLIGKYDQIQAEIFLKPSNPSSLRDFILNCDIVIHQIPNQSILFSVDQDWQNGISAHNAKQIGIIATDIPTGKIFPLKITTQQGSWWLGFKNMVLLGIKHIAEGTDHLLFILVLLLPIPLLVANHRWAKPKNIKTSLIQILKVITAFTIGHSFTLLLGSLGWNFIPSHWIEIFIGITILITAIHAIIPIFQNREVYIALGFGLIHGLAFANTLEVLHLDTASLLWSVLGFNLGIEIMQIFVILVVIPWILLLSRTSVYPYFRVIGAVLAVIAAIAWIFERATQKGNIITEAIFTLSNNAIWILISLAILSIFAYFMEKKRLA